MSRPEPLHLTVSRTVAAPPEVIFDLLTDVERMPDWSPEVVESSWVGDATAPAVGARFTGKNVVGTMSWSTKPKITELAVAKVFEFRVPAPSRSTWRYELTPAPDGTIVTETLTQSKRTPAPLRFLQRRAGVTDRAADVRAGMATTLERLAATAERHAGLTLPTA